MAGSAMDECGRLMQLKRIVIGDDHPMFREGMGHLAQAMFPEAQIDFAETMQEVCGHARQGEPPELFLLDLMFPGMEIEVTLPELRRKYPLASIILISMIDDEATVALALRSGGDGFIHKAVPRERCSAAIARVLDGEYVVELEGHDTDVMLQADAVQVSLTARQRTVLDMLGDGASNKEIARELGISHLTVRLHVSAVLRLLGVTKRKEAVAKAKALGLLDETDEPGPQG